MNHTNQYSALRYNRSNMDHVFGFLVLVVSTFGSEISEYVDELSYNSNSDAYDVQTDAYSVSSGSIDLNSLVSRQYKSWLDVDHSFALRLRESTTIISSTSFSDLCRPTQVLLSP